MSRRIASLLVLVVSSALPIAALRAQQPPPPNQNEPTAKDVAKAVAKSASSQAKESSDPIERIKDESLKRSQVMATLSYLSDVIGPRLTGSPNMKRANEWTRDKLAEWGLTNAHLEPWGPFGRSWTLQKFSAQVLEPQCIPLIAYPKAWSPGIEGTLTGDVVHFEAKSESDFSKYRGQLKGAIVLTGPIREVSAHFEPLATRMEDKDLLELANASEPNFRRGGRGRQAASGAPTSGPSSTQGNASAPPRPPGPSFRFSPEMRAEMELARKRLNFLVEEGAGVVLEASRTGDGGTLFVAQASVPSKTPVPQEFNPLSNTPRVSAWSKDGPKTVPQVVVAKEHFNRLVRMIQQGQTLKMAIELAVQYHDDAPTFNTVAEIPGTDLKDEIVMLGGHMDSWHSGTGATDNAAGVAVGMEAVRILKALNLKPRRTIRIALWSGEEQGLLGSRAYVAEHFGKAEERSRSGDAAAKKDDGPAPRGGPQAKAQTPPRIITKPEHEKFSVYFNLDNGTGKVRGVYLQGNEAARPIFRRWLVPFHDMGASTLTLANTGGTDHQSFDAVGLPGFQFIQDVIEYNSRTHHSNQDVFDRIQADDMKQAAAVMAAFVYNAANLDEKLPRKPQTTRPAAGGFAAGGQ